MKPRSRILRTFRLVAMLSLSAMPASALSFVEDFSDGLADWAYTSPVTANAASPGDGLSALLPDTDPDPINDGTPYNYLYRPLTLGPGSYRIEFDFLASLSDDVPYEHAPDAFAALLVFSDEPVFDVGSPLNDFLTLLTLDTTGQDANGGTVTLNAAIGGDWQHYALNFTTSRATMAPYFDLFGPNGTEGDSYAQVDNIVISNAAVVPEPASFILWSLAGASAVVIRRFKRRT